MLHIYHHEGSKAVCINAVKGHLDLMMGEIFDRMNSGKPLYSFEATEVDAKLVRDLVHSLDFFRVGVRYTEELNGVEEVITKEMLLNLLDSGQLIARQVEADMEREADEE